MSEPKLHHYVPQFYLKRFGDQSGRFFVWDKNTSKVFPARSGNVAAEKYFYRVAEFSGTGVDPFFLEKNLSKMEGDASTIHREILAALPAMQPGQFLELSRDERDAFATFISMQFLRTADHRDVLALFAQTGGHYPDGLSDEEKINLHAQMLCEVGGLVETIGERIFRSIWIYARNRTNTPFWTSDNPVCFKTGDNRMWLKGPGILNTGSYVVYPLSPEFVLYCKEPEFWKPFRDYDSSLSPVSFTDEMVQHENAGQVFMATRHVISPEQDFAFADEFAKTIGTDIYAPKYRAGADVIVPDPGL